MALTATISSPSPSSVPINQQIQTVITLSNSGASAINVTSLIPFAFQTANTLPPDASSYSVSSAPISNGFTVAVPASGTLAIPATFCIFVPGTYSLNANIQASDGELITCSSPATVTVTQLNFMDAT